MTHKFPCFRCDGGGLITRNDSHNNDPQADYDVSCPSCRGTCRAVCDWCSHDATIEAWTIDDGTPRYASLSLLCAECLAQARREGLFVAHPPVIDDEGVDRTTRELVLTYLGAYVFGPQFEAT